MSFIAFETAMPSLKSTESSRPLCLPSSLACQQVSQLIFPCITTQRAWNPNFNFLHCKFVSVLLVFHHLEQLIILSSYSTDDHQRYMILSFLTIRWSYLSE
jgi:hypothetical protein